MRSPAGLLLVASLAACSDSGESSDAGSGMDAAADVFSCGDPNDKGVGAVCTKGGNQCMKWGAAGANICSCDYAGDTPLPFCGCSRFCTLDGDCGTGAKCCPLPVSGLSLNACVPMGCLDMGGCPTVATDAGTGS